MNAFLNLIILSIINLFSAYNAYLVISCINEEKVKNRKIEIFSYIFLCFVNVYMIYNLTNPSFMILLTTLILIILSLNYDTSFLNKFISITLVMLCFSAAELLVSLVLGDSVTSVMIVTSKSLYKLLSMRILEFITAVLIKSRRTKNIQYVQQYMFSLVFLSVIFVHFIFQSESFSVRAIILSLLIFFYMMLSLGFLYSKDQKEKKLIQKELENLKYLYNSAEEAYHTLATVEENMENHVDVLRDLMKSIESITTEINSSNIDNYKKELVTNNSKAIAYLNNLAEDALPHKKEIITGNVELDAVINSKITAAKEKGIEVIPTIMLVQPERIIGYVITSVLAPLFDAAIEETAAAECKKIYFFLNSMKGPLWICLKHTDEADPSIRENNEFIYRNDFKMRGVKRTLKKYHGKLEIRVEDHIVETFAYLHFL